MAESVISEPLVTNLGASRTTCRSIEVMGEFEGDGTAEALAGGNGVDGGKGVTLTVGVVVLLVESGAPVFLTYSEYAVNQFEAIACWAVFKASRPEQTNSWSLFSN